MTRAHAYLYFPGCSPEGSNRAYDVSPRNVARTLGVQLEELADWNCCGSTAYFGTNKRRALVLAARNLALAEDRGRDLVTVCSGCYLALHKTNHLLQGDAALCEEVRAALRAGGLDYHGSVRVRHFLDVVVADLGQESVQAHVVRPLHGLDVACYYGCQLTRPYEQFDHAEFPESMDRLVGWLGAKPVPYPLKAKCCGGMLMTTQSQLARDMVGKLLRTARRAGAACIATACPLCQMNLEGYHHQVAAERGEHWQVPVLYFTQLLGWALGLGKKDLALSDSLTDVVALLARQGVAS